MNSQNEQPGPSTPQGAAEAQAAGVLSQTTTHESPVEPEYENMRNGRRRRLDSNAWEEAESASVKTSSVVADTHRDRNEGAGQENSRPQTPTSSNSSGPGSEVLNFQQEQGWEVGRMIRDLKLLYAAATRSEESKSPRRRLHFVGSNSDSVTDARNVDGGKR